MIACSQVGRLAWRLVVHSDLGLGDKGIPMTRSSAADIEGILPHLGTGEAPKLDSLPPGHSSRSVGRSVA